VTEGRPDLWGLWAQSRSGYVVDIAKDLKPNDVPFQPWAKALFDRRVDGSHSKEDPDANCRHLVFPESAPPRHRGKLSRLRDSS